MNITGLLLAGGIIGAIGIIIGVLLGIASEKFKVEVDEKEILVRDELPGNNCGGCGYAGCDGLAAAIAAGEASANACPVGGPDVADKIAAIMGIESGSTDKKVAYVKCKGTCEKTTQQYHYYGISDCSKIAVVPGAGEKACAYGCMGYGSCVKACNFDAIHVVDGVAVVDKEKCVACGKCVTACPNQLVELVPYKAKYLVQCASHDKGKDVKAKCANGCIGCTLCTKQCPFEAIAMDNNVAVIDYSKCKNCGKCAGKCPAKIIC
ncbi:MAG: RnfABCDGE type electron transport complex subunit B [Lachnospiraceae bacterium]